MIDRDRLDARGRVHDRAVRMGAARVILAFVLAGACALAGCVLFGLEDVPCARDDGCVDGFVCADDLCVPRSADAGPADDADAGAAEDDGGVVDAGPPPTPVYTDEFSATGDDWVDWVCALPIFDLGTNHEIDDTGVMIAANHSRMDCGVNFDLPDVDLAVDIAFDATDAEAAAVVAANESILVTVRDHLIDQEPLWITNELDAVFVPTAADAVSARFVAAGPVRQGETLLLDSAPIAEASAGVSLFDRDAPARIRVRVDGSSPTHLRLKIWRASDDEPAAWLLDTTLDNDAPFLEDDFGIALNLAYTSGDAVPVVFDHFVMYDAADVAADEALP